MKRSLHNTSSLRDKNDKPPNSSTSPDAIPQTKKVAKQRELGPKDIKRYTRKEKARLAMKYTPAQIAAIQAGEAAIDPKDLWEQGAFRQDPYAIDYQTDDFSKIVPVIDKPIPAPEENWDPKMRFKTENEIASDLREYLSNAPKNATPEHYTKFLQNMRLKVGKEEAERNPRTYVREAIPKGIPALERAVKKEDNVTTPGRRELMKLTGLDLKTLTNISYRSLVSHRVVNQTRLGKIQSMYYLAIAGNRKGLLGIGEGKSTEAARAQAQAIRNAYRNMKPIPRYEERTIYGDVKVKMGAVEIELMNRPPGK